VLPVGTKVPQEHGGSLQVGNPGNAGGTGRPPSQIRAALAAAFDKRIVLYEQIADNKKLPKSERLKALSEMGRLGLHERQIEVADIRQHPEAQRFIAAYHQALELADVGLRERIVARVDELLQQRPT
jgi:hypothetical protein